MPRRERELSRRDLRRNADRNVIVITRYGESRVYAPVEASIKAAAERFGFAAFLARDLQFSSDLWANVEFCLQNSRYAVVVLDKITQRELNSNVAIELGYMLGIRRECLILRDASVDNMPSDIIHKLYTGVDLTEPSAVQLAVEEWLSKLGHSREQPIETISAAESIDAKISRTQRIERALAHLAASTGEVRVRHAGSLSSLAISEKEELDDSDSRNRTYRDLLLKERTWMRRLIEDGHAVKCIISPDTQVARIRMGLVTREYVERNILPRYEELITTIQSFLEKPSFQIVYAVSLPHANLLILGDEGPAIIGRHRLRDFGFPLTTVVYRTDVVRQEVEEFDLLFFEAAATLLRSDQPTEDQCASVALKECVIERLLDCQKNVMTLARSDATRGS